MYQKRTRELLKKKERQKKTNNKTNREKGEHKKK